MRCDAITRGQIFACNPLFRRRLLPVLIAGCFGAGAFANPAGPQVVNGQAGFSSQGNVLSVTNSPGAIINWQSFSINPGELTRFIQQNPNSAVLNRIVGQDPSQILGALQSNGRVFLINPNGILFGQGAQIDVNGLVASTLNLSNEDFISGKLNFKAGDKAGNLKNQGTITTPAGGQVYLIAPNVENSGIITSPKGEVMLAAGHTVQLVDSMNPDLRVVLSAPDNEALNLGSIVAQGGRTGIYGALIKQRGIVNADSAVVGENGKVVFKASKETILDAGSRTTATGAGKGGEVVVQGEQVGLFGDARIDASGDQGGGTVLIGGDYQGRNAAVQNAQVTYLDKDSVIKADALGSGDGGKVIAWADNTTRAYGSISARGGAHSGNGGFVETSGKKFLDATRAPNVAAPNGKGGEWLLDPETITISSAGNINIAGGSPFTPTVAGTASVLLDTTLAAALNAGGIVTVDTTSTLGGSTGNIIVDSSATALSTLSPTSPATLNLYAYNDINVNASIKATAGQSLSMNFVADKYSQAGTTGAINVASGVQLDSRNGTISMSSKGAINLGTGSQVSGGSGTLTFASSAGDFTMSASSQVSSASNINITATNINLNGALKHSPDLSSNGVATLTASGNIDLQGTIEGASTDTAGYSVKLLGAGSTVTTGAGETLTINGSGENTVVELGNGKTWSNSGTVNLTNASQIRLYDGSTYSTFTNNSGAQFNSSASNWIFFSPSDLGTINNNGAMTINTNSQAFEAKFNQGATGSLTLGGGVTLSLQNALDVQGSINLPGGETLWVSESHGSPATFTNTTFAGNGTLNVSGPSFATQAVFDKVSAPTTALTVGAGGSVTISGGTSVFSSATGLTNGLTLNGGTLAINGGGFVVPTTGVTYTGNVGYYAAGALSVPATAAINTAASSGNITLIGGWNGSTSTPLATGAGGITITDSQVITNGAAAVAMKAGTAGITTSGTGTGAGGLFVQGGQIGLDSIGPITIGKLDGNVVGRTTAAGTAAITIHDAGALIVGASAVGTIPAGFSTNGSNINLTADAGTLVVNGAINAGTGAVALNSTSIIDVNTPITTNNGNVTLNGPSAINIPSQINAGTGTVTLTSSGAVYGSSTSPDIIAGLVDITAGSIDGGGGLHINAPRISSLTASSGGINIRGLAGLTLGPTASADVSAVSAASGTVTIKTDDPYPLTVNGNISASGNISLTAGNGASASSTATVLTINRPVTSSSGTITLAANSVSGTSVPTGANVTLQTFTGSSSGSSPPPEPPTLDQCVANTSLSGCSAVLPTLSDCTADPSKSGCSAVLPTVSTCTTAPTTAGCAAVLPTLSACTVAPATAGCTAVLPSVSTCTSAPTTEGCTAVLPSVSACTIAPATAGCSAVLPTLSACTSVPATAGCTAVLPSVSACTTAPATAGCSVVLPTLSACTAAPATAGCTAVLPSVSACTAAPTTAGCTAVLPTVSACTAAPTTAGCSAVLPPLSACTATPSLEGCAVVLPTLSQCSVTPTLAGCDVVLPIASKCTLNPSAEGCATVLPTPQAGAKETITETVISTTNTLVNATSTSFATQSGTTTSQGGGSGSSSGGAASEKDESKKDDKKTISGTKDDGAKKNEPAKKLYCN